MKIIRRNILSLFTGVIILNLLFNPVKGILDIPHQSDLLTCTSLSILIGISTFFPNNRPIQRLTVIDEVFILIAISSIHFYPPQSSLYGLPRFVLVIIYWGYVRQSTEERLQMQTEAAWRGYTVHVCQFGNILVEYNDCNLMVYQNPEERNLYTDIIFFVETLKGNWEDYDKFGLKVDGWVYTGISYSDAEADNCHKWLSKVTNDGKIIPHK